MKIIIAYDGSAPARAALEELRRAGLPQNTEALVISVVERWPTPMTGGDEKPLGTQAQAEEHADEAAARLRELFPTWSIAAEGGSGSPSRLLIQRADEWKADLVVVGSHGRATSGRFVFGSVSQQVVTGAHCPVRVARKNETAAEEPVRLLLAVDGSPDSEYAFQALLERPWPPKSKVWMLTAIGHSYDQEEEAEKRKEAEALHARMAGELHKAGLASASIIDSMDPKYAILSEADEWKVDCIVMGARGLTPYERSLLGSISASIAARAECSVEIVRGEHNS